MSRDTDSIEATERWDDHLRQRDGESNAEYWDRQREWLEREAIRIDAWCQGARAALKESP